jgi:uncharacterized protein (TIGR02271 family)
MNFRTMMLAGPARANELFARLAETSDGAVKTREKLFAELKAELELFAGLEEQHLFPILRRNPETRELAADAVRDNKELRAKLAELDALPKGDEAFAERLKELQTAFRQHARDDKKELLPAVQRALSEEQVQQVAERMEAGLAEAEQAKQDEAEERRAKAREEREQAEREARQAEAAERAREAAERHTREVSRRIADAALAPAGAAVEAAGQVTRLAAAGVGAAGATADRRRAPPPRAAAPQLSDLFFWPWLGVMQGLQQASDRSASGGRAAAAARGPAGAEEVVPLGEEVLEVGKRTVERGTARVRRHVVETPVERQVALQSERVVVERRRPVTDTATGEVLTELTLEVTETEEVPVVSKRTRLREEIVVRTERTQRLETVRETLRRDEVEIRQPGGPRAGQQRQRPVAAGG